ncbi:uncharacterized protein [Vicugna pacos]|uniref:Uncharacterized protein n=1 Tax=Vicugna pacos TaxID=30538 RepID=A0ABM5C8J9_VICPA
MTNSPWQKDYKSEGPPDPPPETRQPIRAHASRPRPGALPPPTRRSDCQAVTRQPFRGVDVSAVLPSGAGPSPSRRLKRLQRRQRSPSGKRGADRAAAAELRAECGGGSGAAPRWFAGGSALGLSRAAAAAAAALFLWEARRGPSGGRPAANMAVVDAAPCDGPPAAVRRRRRSSNLVLRRGLQLRGVESCHFTCLLLKEIFLSNGVTPSPFRSRIYCHVL